MNIAHLCIVLLWLAVVVGWVINLLEVIQMAFGPSMAVTTLFVVKAIGILVGPLGAIMGLFF